MAVKPFGYQSPASGTQADTGPIDFILEEQTRPRRDFFEFEGQRYRILEKKDVKIGDFILIKDGKLKRILDIVPLGGYHESYFQTSETTEIDGIIKRPGYTQDQISEYGRRVN